MADGLKQEKTDLVSFEVLSDGTAIKETYQVLSISVNKTINKIPTASITLLDGEADTGVFEVSSAAEFEPGKEITLMVGYHGENEKIFTGIITKHGINVRKSRPTTLVVELKDVAVKMTIGRKNAYFTDKTDSDIIDEILGKYSDLKATVDATKVKHTKMVQYNATDWDFMMMRAEANGLVAIVNDGEISIVKPEPKGDGKVKVIFGSTIEEFEAETDARNQYTAVKASAWDYATQAIVSVNGEDPKIETNGNFVETDLAAVAAPESFDMIHSGQITEPELQAWADAVMYRSRISKVRGRVKFMGFSDILPGELIELEGVGERFEGNAYVSGVSHSISGGNWTTDVQFGLSPKWLAHEQDVPEKPAGALLPPIHGLQIGIVTKLEGDPDGEDRIQVKVPVISTEEDGIWVRVATLDAGDTRGSFFRPEIDDEVILGFLNDDPREPIMLGMLNSSAKPAPMAGTDDNHEKGFFTRSEMKFVFNDDEISVKIETPGGNIVTISDDKKGIILEDQNGNKIEMNDKGIAIESAKDFTIKATGDVKVEGVNIELKSSADFKIDGGAGAEVSTSAIAKIKGSLVQIN